MNDVDSPNIDSLDRWAFESAGWRSRGATS